MVNNPIDLSKIKTVSLDKRPSKVDKSDFAKTLKKPVRFKNFLRSMPDIFAGKNLKNLVDLIIKAKKRGKPVIFTFGAHVLKCGLAPLLIDLADKGFITAFASNGASSIHDFELAYSGFTSEDVEARLKDGSFGMTRETGEFLNNAAIKAYKKSQGLGFTIGQEIEQQKLPNRHLSVYASAYRLGVPITTHVAIGTDIIYQHPQCDGAAWGSASYQDFLLFAASVSPWSGWRAYEFWKRRHYAGDILEGSYSHKESRAQGI